jgi:hypothetical protein
MDSGRASTLGYITTVYGPVHSEVLAIGFEFKSRFNSLSIIVKYFTCRVSPMERKSESACRGEC